ncbi:hypothetical protein A8C75_22625 [Marinobacterium aestuarii]|uniref:DUF262 domain-containing protein n=1 Tax=Marinobacterium aestuarii TaxID=1821621 RepID=A0A1A9F445_9GAMM|nr:DUF262 domain-containing protein [Marinobacterium aestuarii]ANG64997.1 hypothetical protein A8C75_22625 [Marinobacterium aestuarii]
MSNITFDRQTVNQALQNKYSLPTYQRDYKWTEKQFRELLTDLQGAFLDNYSSDHGRKDVGSYEDYFLGTIITTSVADGVKSIIDGQQRLTTITLLLSWFQRKKLTDPSLSLADLDSLIRRELWGDKDYNLSFDGPRAQLFNLLLDASVKDQDLSSNVESVQGLDQSGKRLFDLFGSIENYLDSQILEGLLPFFSDFVVNKVLLTEIGVPSEQDAHRVFVTMNDRGLKLSPIDLLKGYLLSNINDDQANSESHEHWIETVSGLKKISSEEDSQFLKTWLRSQYGESIRGKSRGDSPGDFEVIGDSYHRWLIDNRERIGLSNSDDFQQLISETMPFYAKIYTKVKAAESGWSTAFPHLFYNGSRNLTLQAMLILASIKIGDTSADVNTKIKLVSFFLDVFATSRVISGKDNTYDNVRDSIFYFAKKIRNLDVDSLRSTLKDEASKYVGDINNVAELSYGRAKRQDILHILGRFGEFLENICSQTNSVRFSGYIDRSLGAKTFDIEHILSEVIEESKADASEDWDFSNDSNYLQRRNYLGGLVLLPRGRNRSLKCKPYSQKLGVYATENVLCQSLTAQFFENNPSAREGLIQAGISVNSIAKFGDAAITERGELYQQVAKTIWSTSKFDTV